MTEVEGTVTETKACDAIRRYLDAFFEARWDDVMPALADDCILIDPLVPEPVRGKQAIRELLAYCHTWGHYRGEVINLFGDEHHVAVQLQISGRVIVAPEGMSADVVGREFSFVECDIFELDEEQRIVKETIYADVVTLQNQLGQTF